MILFDLDMPKWVLFFYPIMKRLDELKKKYIVVSRGGEGYNELNKVLDLYKISYISIGEYGGASLEGKLKASIDRQIELIEIVKKYNIKKVVSGSVVDINRVAFGLGIDVINFNDMPMRGHSDFCKEVTHVTKLTAPFSSILFKPFMVPDEVFEKLGVCNIKTYNFLDPLIWLKDFKVDKEYVKEKIPKINFNKPIVVVREEEFKASYVQNQYSFLYETIKDLQNFDINLIIIPRYETTHLKENFKNVIILEEKIILQHLLAISDLFIGGGGTINIEATYFGVPVISTRSFISHYDKFLIDNELMYHSNDKEEIINLSKKLISNKNIEKSREVFGKMEMEIDLFVKEIIS
jgi:predicted glycosyltransferase